MHGAPLTDLDGHPLDTGVDDPDEKQETDEEYAAFRYVRQQRQFRSQKPTTLPDDHLSDEAKVRVAQGLSVEGMGLGEPDEEIETTPLNETVRRGAEERRAQAEQEATGASSTYTFSDVITGRLIGAVRRDGTVVHIVFGEVPEGLLAYLERRLHKGGVALMERYMSSVSVLQAGYKFQRVDE